MQIVGQLPVIATWRDAPLVLEDLAETICIIKRHAPPPPAPSVSNTNLMTTRESQMIFRELNTDLQIDNPQL